MEIEMKEHKLLEDGKHEGTVEKIEYRDEPYKYTDVFIKVDEESFDLKYGVPTSAGMEGKLAKLLGAFANIVPGEKYDPEKILVGKRVSFMTIQEKRDGGTFVKIVDGSIKPVIVEEKVA